MFKKDNGVKHLGLREYYIVHPLMIKLIGLKLSRLEMYG